MNFHVSFCQLVNSHSKIYTSRSKFSTHWRDTRRVFVPGLLGFLSRADEVLSWTALERTFMHKVDHSSDLERATQEVETCGPASVIVELEQTLYTVS